MQAFLDNWHQAAITTLGLFWMAFWAFGLGYLISSMIQVFVTRERMKKSMGQAGAKSVGLASFFGFISSSCSFAALATTRALFAKGAGLVPSLAFLLASTNLVIELGIVIAVFLSWQFVVGEYLGGVLLILLMWLLVRLTVPDKLVKKARERAREAEGGGDGDEDIPDWKKLIQSRKGWRRVANRYVMEWHMVWKDVTVGFTVAGIIAVFVPKSFFQSLFVGAGEPDPAFWEVLLQCLVGPVAAFFTFIGSMGNIPLAAVLFDNGVAFAGIMAFIFSDLVVLPVLRIQAQYYGWKMALYILGVFLVILVSSALMLHYGFAFFDLLPSHDSVKKMADREFFKVDYTLFLNLLFAAVGVFFLIWRWRDKGLPGLKTDSLSERILLALATLAITWLVIGTLLPV
ncbi:permease [Microbulbifer flavimaris]|uniref:Permease n=1 Tax=Microbulbifer flavimaris TaxID=1781068 RepID=A0ABX4I1D2_9GAMM|nr:MULTISPECIES: permease [Microbulbifer]KUJ83567.1 permease [Microbulbifer sp. ZGT114]PCO05725.1 permease [Microbulbifer flavimaris]